MLVRRTDGGQRFCVHQEHHGMLSGVLAAQWQRRLPGPLLAAITLHDNAWRRADAEPRFDPETRSIVDFIDYPKAERLQFYERGIDELEAVDAYTAFMVSRHYSSFAGTRDLHEFQASESTRRRRLRESVSLSDDELDKHLAWIRFFDVFSLHLCLTGPDVDEESVPRWLRDPSTWTTSPDGEDYEIEWAAPFELRIDPWPFFTERFEFNLQGKKLARPSSADELPAKWSSTPWVVECLKITE